MKEHPNGTQEGHILPENCAEAPCTVNTDNTTRRKTKAEVTYRAKTLIKTLQYFGLKESVGMPYLPV